MELFNVSDDFKPTLKTLTRAYCVGWSATTVPSILSVLVRALLTKKHKAAAIEKALFLILPQILKKSVTKNGFPLLLAGSFGGEKAIRFIYSKLMMLTRNKKRALEQKKAIFWSALISIWSVRRLYPGIKTLDLTFFALVRACDVFAHKIYASPRVRSKVPEWTLEYGNVAVFMLASTEIIFSWFYEPERLPKSYAGWITNMSGIDDRLLKALRALRSGDWIYGKETGLGNLLGDYCIQLGLPRSFGDPCSGRIDCSVIHEGNLWGCEVNAFNRFYKGFMKIFPVYFSVHSVSPLFFKTSQLFASPASSFLHILLASARSSTFLGAYIAIIWYSICLVRTRIGHQVLGVNQQRLDDTLGPLAGAMLCGLSLLVESKHRRGEMTLYVAPRALFSLTERILGPHQKGRWWELMAAETSENIVFAASVMVVLGAVYNEKFMVRPSVRGGISWILKDEIKQHEEATEDGVADSGYGTSGDSTPIESEYHLEITKKRK